MEEVKKKRWRPSLLEFRMLEREYSDCLHAYAKKKEEFARLEEALKKAVDRATELERLLGVEEGLKESACRQIDELRGRGFWRRVLNR